MGDDYSAIESNAERYFVSTRFAAGRSDNSSMQRASDEPLRQRRSRAPVARLSADFQSLVESLQVRTRWVCDFVDRRNDGTVVVVHNSMHDRVAIPVAVELDVGCSSVRSRRVANASEIDGPDTVDQSIGDIVSVAGEHDVGVAMVKKHGQVGVADAGVDTFAVV